MRHARRLFACCGGLLALALVAVPSAIAEDAAGAEAPDKPAVDPVASAIKQINEQDNGVTIDTEKGFVDVDGKVCLRSAEFLEMFACTPDTREHESLVVLGAKPSTIHFALLLLGQEPGKPLSYDQEVNPPKLVPAKGPEVEVYVVLDVAGQERETPANRWVQDNQSGEMMEGNTWLFAGSVFVKHNGKEIYLADLNGSAISLVNFGDDLLTLPNTMTQDNLSHEKTWAPRTRAIPKVGTAVKLRLKVKAEKPADEAGGDAAVDGDEADDEAAGEPQPGVKPVAGEPEKAEDAGDESE